MSLDPCSKLSDTAPGESQGAVLARLREAYIDLEATKPLRELGQTTAFINHEIKNYMMVISGYAALLLRSKNLSEKDRNMVDSIAQTAARLQEFNLSVLEMSKSNAGIRMEEFDLAEALASCADARFPADMDKFAVSCSVPGGALLVNGNREKLERAFSCAFRNSLEAGARKIGVRMSVYNYIALIVIEDDGIGCDADGVPNLSKTFFTTKRGDDGIGLGLCALRSIIEAHGGNVSIYSKNLLGEGSRGLKVIITLPASKRNPSAAVKAETLVVRDGFSDIGGVLRVLKNIKTIPRIAAGAKDAGLAERSASLDLAVFAAAPIVGELKAAAGENTSIKILSIEEGEGGALFVADGGGGRNLITEEYIAEYLSNPN